MPYYYDQNLGLVGLGSLRFAMSNTKTVNQEREVVSFSLMQFYGSVSGALSFSALVLQKIWMANTMADDMMNTGLTNVEMHGSSV